MGEVIPISKHPRVVSLRDEKDRRRIEGYRRELIRKGFLADPEKDDKEGSDNGDD